MINFILTLLTVISINNQHYHYEQDIDIFAMISSSIDEVLCNGGDGNHYSCQSFCLNAWTWADFDKEHTYCKSTMNFIKKDLNTHYKRLILE